MAERRDAFPTFAAKPLNTGTPKTRPPERQTGGVARPPAEDAVSSLQESLSPGEHRVLGIAVVPVTSVEVDLW
jgi:hypothetical protein